MRKREIKRLMAIAGKLTPGQRREGVSELLSDEYRTVATLLNEHYPTWREARAELNELPLMAEVWRE